MPQGYSYLQVLVVVAVLTVLAAVASPFYVQFQYRQRLHSTADILLSDLRLAQAKAMQSEQGDQWGLRVNNGSKAYTIFYGSTFNASEPNNYSVSYANSVSVSPDQNIVFEPVTGQLTGGGTATIVITASNLDESRSLTINSEGMIQAD